METKATLSVIASGSSGNCYILTAGQDKLILECGVKAETLLKALDYTIEGVKGVLISHKHQDHAKYVPQISKYFTIYSNEDVAEKYPEVKPLKPKIRYKIGSFVVVPLEVEHGVPNFAYLIWHELTGWIVFATDCTSFPYKFRECISTMLIECNYVEEVVLNNMMDNEDVRSQVDMHMELSQTIDAVRRLQNPLLRNVILCHLSGSNSDREIISQRSKNELGITPQFAIRGAEFDISQFDF